MKRPQFLSYLLDQLIPDFHEADMHATAEDYETAAILIQEDMKAMWEARKALLAATVHTRQGSNAEALCKAAIATLDETLGIEPEAVTVPVTAARSRRCLEDRSNLTDR